MKNKSLSLIMAILVMILKCYNSELILNTNTTGYLDGYRYEFFKEGDGSAQMRLLGGGIFHCKWMFAKGAYFRIGKRLDNPKLWNEFGNFTVKYNAQYFGNRNSALSIYGRNNALYNEFYIVESWGDSRPSGQNHIGSILVDGDDYDMYVSPRYKILGMTGVYCTFKQLWSVRRNKRTEGIL